MKILIKKILNKLRIVKRKFGAKISRFCSKSRLLASLYYFIYEPSFGREHQAVLAGKIKHIEDSERLKANYYLLVRNTHRLEKGLLMRPRRNIFALAYIGETIDSFEGIWEHGKMSTNPQMKWFYDVLTQYFAICGGHKELKEYYDRFKNKVNGELERSSFVNNEEDGEVTSTPYHRQDNLRSNISYEEFYKLSYQRRSVRWFQNRTVPREIIDKAVLAAAQSPSACNRQPFEFRIFDDQKLAKKGVGFPMGTKGYGHNIPVFIVLVGNLDAYFSERDRHIIYIDASLAAMSFMLALETMGVSSCAINWPDIEEREKMMENFLNLKSYQRPVMCLGIGYPDSEGLVAYSAKKPLDQIRVYN